ncbi:hypothetical protein ACFY3G_53220, partial [Streptomyces phaeochromogenes]
RERYPPVGVRPGQTPAHSRPLIAYTTTRDTIISSACCAVNAVVWGLGRRVLISCTDTLHEGDGTERALAERTAIFARRNELIGRAQTIAATYEAIAEVEDLISRGPGPAKAS